MPTVLWETLRCCITLHCVVRLGLIMSWPSMFLFRSAIFPAINPLKNVSSEFLVLCKKAAPFHFIDSTPQLVLSALIGNFANNVECFSRIVSHPNRKVTLNLGQWENTTLHESDCSFRTVEVDMKHQRKITSFFWGGPWPLRPHSGCASAKGRVRRTSNQTVSDVTFSRSFDQGKITKKDCKPIMDVNWFLSQISKLSSSARLFGSLFDASLVSRFVFDVATLSGR